MKIPQFPVALTLHEKIGDRNFLIRSEAELYEIALLIVRRRLTDGGWYENEARGGGPSAEGRAKLIIDTGDGMAALRFLQQRDAMRAEYEGMTIGSFELLEDWR